MSVLASLSIATVLAFHPYSAPSPSAYLRVAPAEGEADKQPGWEDVEADAAPPATEEPPAPTVDPASVPPPVPAPPPVAKPQYNKGTGLIIGASVTGGIAWILGLTRMAFVKQCTDQLQASSDVPTGLSAVNACAFKAGAAGAAMGIVQVPMNWATWGLAAGAGAVRGRYDGVEQAWAKGESKKTGAFVGAGAALIAVGAVGRIVAGVMVFRPYRNFADDLSTATTDDDTNAAVDRLSGAIRGRLFGLQLSSAMIGAGAGLLAYGIAYRKNFESEGVRLQQVRLAPEFNMDRASGSMYTGLALSARF